MYPLSAGVTPHWDDATLFLYIVIAAIAALLLLVPDMLIRKSKRRRSRQYASAEKLAYVFSCLVLVVFKGGCVGTTDVKNGYYMNFTSATSMADYYDQTTEILHRLLMVIVRNVTSDYRVYLLVVALITLVPVYYALWQLRDRVSAPFAILSYGLIFMPMGMSLIRIAIASSLLFLSFVQYAKDRKLPAIIIFIAAE